MQKLTLALIISCVSCGQTESSLKHDRQRYSSESTLEPCKLPDYTDYPHLKAYQVYVQKLANIIAARNPHIFAHGLDISRFCIMAVGGALLQASAVSENGEVRLYSPMIEKARTEGEIVAVLSHELAHVALNHSQSSVHPHLVGKEKEIEEITQRQTRLFEEIMSERAALFDTYRTLFDIRRYESLEKMLVVAQDQVDDADVLAIHLEAFKAAITALGENELNNLDKGRAVTAAYALAQQLGFYDARFAEFESSLTSQNGGATRAEQQEEIITSVRSLRRDLAALATVANTLEQRRKEVEGLLDRYLSSILGGLEVVRNWREQEADELGFEMMLRSGIAADQYFKLMETVMVSENIDPNTCWAVINRGEEPPRGIASHPDYCWRIWNLKVMEPKRHPAYAAYTANTATRFPELEGELERILSAP